MANETILIVDADTKSQKVLEVSFKKAGYRVVVTDSVQNARETLDQIRPSLIISETALPDGDGLEWCADLKGDDRWKSTPFIFLTEDRSLTQKMRSFELGADDYLTKPVYIKEVTTRVDLLMQRRAKDLLSESDVEEFEGNLSDITMIDLLQTIEEELRSGSIRINRGGRQAAVYFREGNVLDAICGKLQGEDAVYRVMLWNQGDLVVRYHENIRRADHIEKDSSTLLLEGIKRLDQFNELIETLPGGERTFEADYQRLPTLLADLPPAVERVVRLFDGYRKLRDVIDDSPVDDVKTLQIIRKLLDDDILLDVTPPETGTPAPRGEKNRLNAWLAGSYEPEPQQGTPFRRMGAERSESGNTKGMKLQPDPEDVSTLDLERERSPAPDGSKESGHWKFHWDENQAAEDGEVDSETALLELEQKEALRREEEARRLTEQMQAGETDGSTDRAEDPSKEDESTPHLPGARETGESNREADLEEDSDADSTQELFVRSEVLTEGYERSHTPLSSPALATRSSTDEDEGLPVATEIGAEESVSIAETGGVDTDSVQETDGTLAPSSSERRAQALDEHEDLKREVSANMRQQTSTLEDITSEQEDEDEERRQRVTMPLDAEAVRPGERLRRQTAPLNMASPLDDENEFSSSDRITARIGIPEEIQAQAQAEEEEQVQPEEEQVQPEEEQVQPEEEQEDGDTREVAPELKQGSMDEVTSPQDLPEAFVEAILDIERTSRDGEIVRTEYDLSARRHLGMTRSPFERSPREPAKAPVANLIKDDMPTPVPPADEFGDPEPSAESEAEPVPPDETVPEKEEAKAEKSPVAESAPEDSFFSAKADDFSDLEDFSSGNNNWKIPALTAAVLTLLVILWVGGSAFLSWISPSSDPAPVTGSEMVVIGEPETIEEAPKPEEIVEAPEPTGIDSEEALARAASESHAVGSSAREMAMLLSGADPFAENAELEESEMASDGVIPVETQPVETLPVETQPVETLPVVTTTPEATTPPVERAPTPPKTEPAPTESATGDQPLATRINVLRGLLRQERTAQALTLARELTAAAPDDRTVAFLHGQAALYDNKNPEAIENLTRAERLGYRSPDLYLELATVYQLTGRRDQAKGAYERFLELQPSGRNADEVRSILQNQF